jgi:hypothetical protein
MPEKRLALNQVPLTPGGSGQGSFSLKTVEIVSTTPLNPIPVAVITPIPGTLINFTLPLDQEVMLLGTGTYENTGAGDVSADFGFRIDGSTDIFLAAAGMQTSGRNEIPFTLHKAIALLAGAHTAEIITRENISATSLVRGTATNPTVMTAFYVEPIAVVASMIRQEAISQAGGSFVTTSTTFLPVPNTQITIDLSVAQTVFLLAHATKDAFFFWGDQLGIRVTSPGPTVTDFHGTRVNAGGAALGADTTLVAQKALSLGPGSHTVEMIFRSTAGFNSARIFTNTVTPAILTALYTNPEEVPKITSLDPTVVRAGDIPAPGLLLEAARADHKHGVDTDVPVDTMKANAEGVSVSLARADHEHRGLIEVQEAGAVIASRPIINIIGATSVVDNGGQDRVDITIGSTPRVLTFKFHAQGKVVVSTKIDGTWLAGRALTITRVTLHRETAGSSGTTIVDVNKNGVTLFTTQANRPQIAFGAGNDQINAHTDMEVTALAQDDKVTVDVDQAEGGNPADVTVTVECEIV